MKTLRTVILVIAAVSAAASAWAVPLAVEFVSGKVMAMTGGSWVDVDIGDKLDSTQTIRLDKGAVLELTGPNNTRIALCAAGVFLLDSYLAPKPATGPAATAAAKLAKLARNQAQETTVGGIRGAGIEPASEEDMMWASSGPDAGAVMVSAAEAHDAGDYLGAWSLFMEAAGIYTEECDPNSAALAAWYASRSGLAAESPARALASLRTAVPEDAGALRGGYTLALAALDARYGSPADAKALLERALGGNWFDDPAMVADAKELLASLR